MTLADRCADWLIAHPRNPLRLPQAPDPVAGSVHERLESAAREEAVLFHGSNARDISRFEPRDQLTARDRPIRAVFATPDPLWAMFFAVTDTHKSIGRWNACLRPEETGFARSRYFFAVRSKPDIAWTEGAVYLLPRSSFEPSDISAEWISFEPVEPLDVVPVTRVDFPFAHRVFRFAHSGDSLPGRALLSERAATRKPAPAGVRPVADRGGLRQPAAPPARLPPSSRRGRRRSQVGRRRSPG